MYKYKHTFTYFYTVYISLISQFTTFSGFVDNALNILKFNKIGLVMKMYIFTMNLKVFKYKNS